MTDTRGGVETEFEAIVAHHQDGLYAFAVALTRDPRQAEDAVQDAFVRAYSALKRYDPERRRDLALRPWLYRITLNVIRNRARRPRREVLLAQVPEQVDPGRGPETELLRRDDARRLLGALGQLPEAQRAAVVLRYVRDLSYFEIAEVLGQPVGSAKSNVHRGVAALRRDFLQEVS